MNISVSRPISEKAIVTVLKDEVFIINGIHVSVSKKFPAIKRTSAHFARSNQVAEFLVALPVLFETADATDASRKMLFELKKITDAWPSSITQLGHTIKPSTHQKRRYSKDFHPALLIVIPENGATELLKAFKNDSDKIVAAVKPFLAKGTSENLPPEEPKITRKYESLRPPGNEPPQKKSFRGPQRLGKFQL